MQRIRVLFAGLSMLVSALTFAAPVTVDFTVTTTRSSFDGTIHAGYEAGVVGTGYFTFDDAIRNVPATPDGMAALDLSVSWYGLTWDETTARIGNLFFNLDGSLRGFILGGWYPGDCGVGCVSPNGPSDFWVGTTNGIFSSLIHDVARPGYIYASTQWSIRPETVPAPGALLLMSLGLFGVAVARHRRARG